MPSASAPGEVNPSCQLRCPLQRGFEGNWLGGTFSKAVFIGNGLIAIVAGLLGHALVEVFKLGPVSPFDAAALVLLVGGAYIAVTWTENYGDSADKAPFHVSLVNAANTIWQGAPFSVDSVSIQGSLCSAAHCAAPLMGC